MTVISATAIGIVGSGSMARAIGRALHECGVSVLALAARNPMRAAHAAAFIHPEVRPVTIGELAARCGRVIVAVSDEALEEVASQLAAGGMRAGITLHTCGARGPGALRPLADAGVACGVLHPLQTIPSPELGVARLRGITYGIGGDRHAAAWAEELTARLDSRALHVSRDGFAAYHAAAVLAGNSVAALLDAATVLMDQAGVDAPTAVEALAPLCRASLDNVLAVGADAALTGPVARGDAATVRLHLEAAAAAPDDVRGLYRAVSRRLLHIARRRGLAAPAAARIDALLQ